jgi:hypothetical protein
MEPMFAVSVIGVGSRYSTRGETRRKYFCLLKEFAKAKGDAFSP